MKEKFYNFVRMREKLF